MEQIYNFYDQYNEEERLSKDNTHRLEFITTTHVLDKYIKKESKLLELGAGTGIYSFYYSKRAECITAVDLMPKHVEKIKEKINTTKTTNIDCMLGDARNLIDFENDSLDIVLCLGPLYHLRNKDDRIRCIAECKRVLKEKGILAIAYINNNAAYIRNFMKDKEFIEEYIYDEFVDNKSIFNEDRDSFYFTNPIEIEDFMRDFGMNKMEHVGTDGVATIIHQNINKLNEAEFKKWIDYHFKTMDDPSLLGYSLHGLYVCQK